MRCRDVRCRDVRTLAGVATNGRFNHDFSVLGGDREATAQHRRKSTTDAQPTS